MPPDISNMYPDPFRLRTRSSTADNSSVLHSENKRLKERCDNLENVVQAYEDEAARIKKQSKQHAAQLEDEAARLETQARHWYDEYMGIWNSHESLESESDKKDGTILELQQQVLQYKKDISGSNRLERQLSDTAIQSEINGLFHAVRDWAVDFVRQERPELDLTNPITADWLDDWLNHQVCMTGPASSAQKVQAVVATFSFAFVDFLGEGWTFGMDSESSVVTLANTLHRGIQDVSVKTPKVKKQWVLATRAVLSEDNDLVTQAQARFSEGLLERIEGALQVLCGRPLTPALSSKLEKIVKPYTHLAQALSFQEADYLWELPVAVKKGGVPKNLDPSTMEDVDGEDYGILQACIFPTLLKSNASRDGNQVEYTVICKAKVSVI